MLTTNTQRTANRFTYAAQIVFMAVVVFVALHMLMLVLGNKQQTATAADAQSPIAQIGTRHTDLQPAATIHGKDITLVTLEDGTRCAVLTGIRAGGIDCDWSTSRHHTRRNATPDALTNSPKATE